MSQSVEQLTAQEYTPQLHQTYQPSSPSLTQALKPPALITKSMLTILCQLTSRVGGSFVQIFWGHFYIFILLSLINIFLNSSVEEHHLWNHNFAGSNPHFFCSALDQQKHSFIYKHTILYSKLVQYQYDAYIETGTSSLNMQYYKYSFTR